MRLSRAIPVLALGLTLVLAVPTAGGACDWDHGRGRDHQPRSEPTYTAAYVYRKVDASRPASWENSGRQTLVAVKEGHSWFETLDVGVLPAEVCGDGWAVQEDMIKGLTREQVPTVVDRATGEGVLPSKHLAGYRHRELSDYLDVPACAEPPTQPVPEVPEEEVPEAPEVPEVPTSPVVVVPTVPTNGTAPPAAVVPATPTFAG